MANAQTMDVRQFIPVPGAPAVANQGSAGSTAYSYKLVAVGVGSSAGAPRATAASAAGSTATGNATLDGTNFNRLTWSDVLGETAYDIYRTASAGVPATTGKIGTVAAGSTQFDDKGLAADGSTPPTVNTTGDGDPIDVLQFEGKTVQISGTFSATIQMEGTITPGAWISEGSAATGAAVVEISKTYQQLRTKMTAYTSGTPVVALGARRNSRD
jgi:hypothetical protein